MAESTITGQAKDEMLFHDLVALAARVEDEAQRARSLSYASGVTPDVAHQAGIAYAKLDTLESVMFDTANTLAHQANDVSPGSAKQASSHWHDQKQACRKARRQAEAAKAERLATALRGDAA